MWYIITIENKVIHDKTCILNGGYYDRLGKDEKGSNF